jgi:hypothetical protein
LILRNLLKAIPKIRNIISAADDFEKLISKYKEGLDKINSDPSLEMLKQFQQDSENNFLLEYDEVSEFISSKLDEIAELKKSGEEKLKKVLIIDDLDRLDPEHIFRLFNIFSAHFDQVHYYENQKGNDNKFGFDKIIFVCDIENIRKIFAHKYGIEVDFSGYIDKFYSTGIYHFLHENVFDDIIKPYFRDSFTFYSPQKSRVLETNELFNYILNLLFKGRELSIREIIRLGKFKPSFISDNKIVNHIPVMLTKMGAKENSILEQYVLLVLIKLFYEVFGGSEIFIKKMNNAYVKISENEDSTLNSQYRNTLNNLILFADAESHKFEYSKDNDQNKKEFELEINGNQVIKYNLIGGYYDYYEEGEMWFRIKVNGLGNLKLTNGFFYGLLIKAIKGIISKGIIQ